MWKWCVFRFFLRVRFALFFAETSLRFRLLSFLSWYLMTCSRFAFWTLESFRKRGHWDIFGLHFARDCGCLGLILAIFIARLSWCWLSAVLIVVFRSMEYFLSENSSLLKRIPPFLLVNCHGANFTLFRTWICTVLHLDTHLIDFVFRGGFMSIYISLLDKCRL